MVVAPIAAGCEAGLRALLDTMNCPDRPGTADPENALLPFGAFQNVHFARFVIVQDETLDDIVVHGLAPHYYPRHLVFMGDCDGASRDVLVDMVRRAGDGLRRLFAHCDDFDEQVDLLAWLCAHDVPVGTNYVNWVGRTVRQIREESALQRALSAKVPRNGLSSAADVQRVRRDLIEYVNAEVREGRLRLTPPATTPWGWQIKNGLNAISLPVLGILTLPLTIVLLPVVLFVLRRREQTDVEYCPRPDYDALQALKRLEDHDVTNQFSAVGSVKPGWFRRWLLIMVLWVTDYGCRHVVNRGHLGRVQSIHFARWVLIDNGRRLVFASNYDGSHESYMDDFVNKVAWGLNATFSHGVGWPKTDWLLKRGARRELKFKYFQRRHHIPSQVWYKAYPGLTLSDINRNQAIREGLERTDMSHEAALAWLKLL